MSAYGKIISGGKAMTRGLTSGINEKLAGFAKEQDRRKMVATAVGKAFNQNPLSDPHVNDINGGKFTTPKLPKNI
jgi:hypothetical protein